MKQAARVSKRDVYQGATRACQKDRGALSRREPAVWYDATTLLLKHPTAHTRTTGVQEHHAGVAHLLYKRTFEVPKEWHRQRIMLRFGAVDWEAKVFVNSKRVGTHRGG